MRRLPVAFAAVLLIGVTAYQWTRPEQPLSAPAQVLASGSCGLAQPAFCDPLNQPTANGPDIRSGDLNGVVWGVSRGTSNDDPGQGADYYWSQATATICGQTSTFSPDRDIRICNGQLFETVDDGGGFTILGMYPRQPFDIAGRTGTVAFDVSADSQCSHCAWPAIVYTDKPDPAPYDAQDAPANSFGISFDATPGFACADSNHTTVMDSWITQNYAESPVAWNATGCVVKGVAGGPLNHIELRMSPTHVEVWGTDPGANNLHQLGFADLQMPLTRGLVWMDDVHYNANKDGNQGTHTFAWANFGFDGPLLPRDLGFDVKDNQNSGGSNYEMLGYRLQGSLTLNINNVTGINNASAALLELNFTPHNVDTLIYSVNGHAAHSQPWPYNTNQTFQSKTLNVPVPLNELVPGTNTVVFSNNTNDIMSIANVDLILVGAGGIVPPAGGGGTPPTPVPAATSTSVPSTPVPPTPVPPTPVPPTPVPATTSTPVPATPVPPTPVPPTPVPQGSNPPSFKQTSNAVPQSSQQVVQVRYNNPQTAGDTNILLIGWNDNTSSLVGVSDSAGNSYQVAVQVARGQKLSQAILYAKNIKAAPAGNTVTVRFNEAVPFADVRILEYGGLDPNNPFDSGSSAAGAGGMATSGGVTTHAPNELIVGGGMTNGGFAGSGQSYTTRVITNPDADIAEDRTAGAAGQYSATAPVNDVYVMQAAAFRAPSGPSPAVHN
ncbi:MAG: hypothetical protein JO020_06540 [Chloroflexi bacterium]|nr:hypothetical protein [Chloroflexota bacterium]